MGHECKRRQVGRHTSRACPTCASNSADLGQARDRCASRRPRFASAPQHEGGTGGGTRGCALIFPLNPPSTIRLQPQRAVAPCKNRREPPMQERRKEGRSPAYLGGQITTDRR